MNKIEMDAGDLLRACALVNDRPLDRETSSLIGNLLLGLWSDRYGKRLADLADLRPWIIHGATRLIAGFSEPVRPDDLETALKRTAKSLWFSMWTADRGKIEALSKADGWQLARTTLKAKGFVISGSTWKEPTLTEDIPLYQQEG